jgi:hypothetical protein
MSNQEKKMDRLVELVEALVHMRISEALEKELDDSKKRKLYELTGKKTQRELASITGMSVGSISGLWQHWHSRGILRKEGKFYYKFFEEENESE